LNIDFNSIKPIYVQIAEAIEDHIIAGILSEGEQAYSQLVLSRELSVNPATAGKGINLLVQKGILEKHRGLSMVVAEGAKTRLLKEKRDNAFASLADELVREARMIGLSEEEAVAAIKERYARQERGGEND
jgi:DNA-binding transcriptional regulator YhcF (GntR family)